MIAARRPTAASPPLHRQSFTTVQQGFAPPSKRATPFTCPSRSEDASRKRETPKSGNPSASA